MTRTSIQQSMGRKCTEWPITDVAYFSASHKYVSAYRADGASLILTDTLQELEADFGALFIRTHRGTLAARHLVESIEHNQAHTAYLLRLKGLDEPVPLARREVPRVRELIRELAA
jgi:DNA-binding LytR/AlgR family response regulator